MTGILVIQSYLEPIFRQSNFVSGPIASIVYGFVQLGAGNVTFLEANQIYIFFALKYSLYYRQAYVLTQLFSKSTGLSYLKKKFIFHTIISSVQILYNFTFR